MLDAKLWGHHISIVKPLRLSKPEPTEKMYVWLFELIKPDVAQRGGKKKNLPWSQEKPVIVPSLIAWI